MLKVKEGTDLEKYGFKKCCGIINEEEDYHYYEQFIIEHIFAICDKEDDNSFYIVESSQELEYGQENKYNMDFLYDMFRDGVIEKVEK